METYKIVIWSIYIGIVCASLYAYYVKHIVGSFIRALIKEEAFSSEKAVSMPDIGSLNSALLKLSLRNGSSLYETVAVLNNKYYIREEKAEKAKKKYKSDIKLYYVLIAAASFLVLAVICVSYYNDLYKYVTDFINNLKQE